MGMPVFLVLLVVGLNSVVAPPVEKLGSVVAMLVVLAALVRVPLVVLAALVLAPMVVFGASLVMFCRQQLWSGESVYGFRLQARQAAQSRYSDAYTGVDF